MVDRFTHTIPGPPPGAGALAVPDVPFGVAAEGFAAATAGAAVAAGFAIGAGAGAAGAGAAAAGAGFAIGAEAAGAAFAAVAAAGAAEAAYQSFTPWCPRQAPILLAAFVYVPSLHCPVEPAGAGPDAAATGAGAAAGAAFPALAVDAAGAAAAGAAALFAAAGAAAGAAAYQSLIPWCPRQAPDFVAAVVYVPSLHCPVEPAGACARTTCDAIRPAATKLNRTIAFIIF